MFYCKKYEWRQGWFGINESVSIVAPSSSRASYRIHVNEPTRIRRATKGWQKSDPRSPTIDNRSPSPWRVKSDLPLQPRLLSSRVVVVVWYCYNISRERDANGYNRNCLYSIMYGSGGWITGRPLRGRVPGRGSEKQNTVAVAVPSCTIRLWRRSLESKATSYMRIRPAFSYLRQPY